MNWGLLDPASLQQLLYQALDASDNIVLVLQQSDDASVGLVVVATNDAFCRKSGFSTPDLIGRHSSAWRRRRPVRRLARQ